MREVKAALLSSTAPLPTDIRNDDDNTRRTDADEMHGKIDALTDSMKKIADAVMGMGSRMDATCERMDSIEKMAKDDAKKRDDAARRRDDASHFSRRKGDEAEDKYGERHDAEESSLREKLEGEGETKEAAADRAKKARKDAEASEKAEIEADAAKKRDDAAKKMADDAAKMKDDAAKRVDAVAGDLDAIKRQVADMAKSMKPRTPEERRAFADAQARADSVYLPWGLQAPPAMDGEDLRSYRRRLVTGIKQHDDRWKGVDIDAMADDASFGIAEQQIFDSARDAARRPVNDATGGLRLVPEKTEAGHTINRFYGGTAWMDDFAGRRQVAIGKWKDRNNGGTA